MIGKIKNLVKTFFQLKRDLAILRYHQSEFLISLILSLEKYKDPKNITRFTFKSFSQFGEDGLINEIFNRIGIKNNFFVEFGVGNGLENNTCFQLVVNKWCGLWIEGAKNHSEQIAHRFSKYLQSDRLKFKNAFVTAENIEQIFKEASVPAEFDLLSIDIDGNDYHIWRAINNYSPRVVVVEYNASYGSFAEHCQVYYPNNVWDRTNNFGTSLKSFELLAKEKGYSLVGCDLGGINAFFVRNDLLFHRFQEPLNADFHYEPPRYYLKYFGGHKPNIPNSK